MFMIIFPEPVDFQWDQGNINKNFISHQVTNEECEEAFFDQGKKIFKDYLHSQREERHLLIGQTKKSRLLFIVFTYSKIPGGFK